MALTKPQDKTALVNLALAQIGESPIRNIDSTTDPAAVNAKAVIDQCILEVQADFSWPELKTAAVIQKDAEYTPTGSDPFSSCFKLPADYVRPCKDVNGLVVTGRGGCALRYYIKGGMVYADGDEIVLNYIRESDDPGEWTPWLVKSVYHAVAILLAPARNKSATLVDRLIQIYEQIVRKRMRHRASAGTVRERRQHTPGNGYDRAGRGLF
ncbi:MAG: hypothetical protein WC959_10770 [Kiritimatiellales bacterium]